MTCANSVLPTFIRVSDQPKAGTLTDQHLAVQIENAVTVSEIPLFAGLAQNHRAFDWTGTRVAYIFGRFRMKLEQVQMLVRRPGIYMAYSGELFDGRIGADSPLEGPGIVVVALDMPGEFRRGPGRVCAWRSYRGPGARYRHHLGPAHQDVGKRPRAGVALQLLRFLDAQHNLAFLGSPGSYGLSLFTRTTVGPASF
jgi:hypothetical protein